MTFQPQQNEPPRFLYWLEGYLEVLLELSQDSDYEAHPDLQKIMNKLQKEIERIQGKNKSSAEITFRANHAPSPSPNDITDVEVHSNSFVGRYPECHDPMGRFQHHKDQVPSHSPSGIIDAQIRDHSIDLSQALLDLDG